MFPRFKLDCWQDYFYYVAKEVWKSKSSHLYSFSAKSVFPSSSWTQQNVVNIVFSTQSHESALWTVYWNQWYDREKTKLQHLVPNNLSFTFLLQKVLLLTRQQSILEWKVQAMPLSTRQQFIFENCKVIKEF